MPADHIIDRRASPLVGHVVERHARLAPQHDHGEMAAAARTRRAIGDRLHFRGRNHIRKGPVRAAGAGRDNIGCLAHQHDRLKVGEDVERRPVEQRGNGGMRIEGRHQGRPVRRRARGGGSTYGAIGTWAVLDDDGRLQSLLQAVLNEPGQGVDGPARRKWNNQIDLAAALRRHR